MQGNLNDLARRLEKQGNTEDAEELKETAEILKEVKDINDKEEIREKGIAQRLKDIAGRKLLSKRIHSELSTHDISNLPTGSYLYRFTGDDFLLKTGKIIIH